MYTPARPCTDDRLLTSQKLAKLDVANPLKKANAAQPAGSHAPELEATTRADTTATDGASAVHGDTVAGMGE